MTLDQSVIANDVRIDEPMHEDPAPILRDCGCPLGEACTCGPRLRIFDPMGRLLMAPVYY